ncbi:MAG: DNA polymerase/3'-5' exonuclease PolX [Myxococcales bacterium]|nr:DNA polymerase/3'-5' exonuclease PolX [Myxococcales bacterium]
MFFEMADLLQIKGGEDFRARAFRRIGKAIDNLPHPLPRMLTRGQLRAVPGIGEGGEHRIKEILRSGTCKDHRELRAVLPPGLRDMLSIEGLGPKRIRLIYQHLRVGTVEELEWAARSGMLARLPGLGETTAESLLRAIEAYRARVGRVPLAESLRRAEAVAEALAEISGVERAVVAGSARRRSPTIGDLDVLVMSEDPGPVMARFLTLPQAGAVVRDGSTFSAIRLRSGQQVDLVVLPPHEYGAALHYFTGSQLHNIAVRLRADRMGLKISEHGVYTRDDERRIGGASEEELFAAVGLAYIAPELREDSGEIEAAERGRLPQLLEASQLRGDLHMHTVASDGANSIREMAERARTLGHEYIAITDHSKAMGLANGLDERRLREQASAIRAMGREMGITVLAGIEVDIMPDGELDLDPATLAELDWVVASVHAELDQPMSLMTRRVIRAIESGVVDCIGHPTGRRLCQRDPSQIDLEAVLVAARQAGVALECNGNPGRLDLDGVECRQAKELGAPIVVSSDAHSVAELAQQRYGVWTARRGWLEAGDVLNTRSARELLEWRAARLARFGFAGFARTVIVSASDAPPGIDSSEQRSEPRISTPDAGDLDVELASALDQRPLPDHVRQRIEGFLRGEQDGALFAALARRSTNPLQEAFGLMVSSMDPVAALGAFGEAMAGGGAASTDAATDEDE